MCLAVPGRVTEIHGNHGVVDFGGACRKVQLDLLKNVREGDFVLVHVGYAIQIVDREEAEKMLESWREITLQENNPQPKRRG